MSIQSEIDRINENIANTYSVLSEAGATAPAAANSENLAETVATISAVLYGKAQNLSEEQKEQARNNIGALGSGEMGDISDVVFITVEDIDEICNPQPDEPDEPVYPPNTFQKVRAFQDGKEYILLFGYNGGYYCMGDEISNEYTVAAVSVPEVTSTDAQITFAAVPVLYTANASGSGFTLHNGSNNLVANADSNSTSLKLNTNAGTVFTVDTSAMGGFDSDEIVTKVDDQAVWLRASFEAGNACLKFEADRTAIGVDYKDRNATYSTGFLSFVLYEKIS